MTKDHRYGRELDGPHRRNRASFFRFVNSQGFSPAPIGLFGRFLEPSRVDDGAALAGILFVLVAVILW